MSDKNFGGVIWTNHALARLRERGVKQGDAWATFNRPQESKKGSAQGSWVYYRTYGNQKIEVAARKNEKGEWIILSVWSQSVNTSGRRREPESLLRLIYRRIFLK